MSSGELRVGDPITLPVSGNTGIIRFVGTTHFSTGLWVGVELHEPQGRNDGSVQGSRYFTCPPKHGLFVRATSCSTKGLSTGRSGFRAPSPARKPSTAPLAGAEPSSHYGEQHTSGRPGLTVFTGQSSTGDYVPSSILPLGASTHSHAPASRSFMSDLSNHAPSISSLKQEAFVSPSTSGASRAPLRNFETDKMAVGERDLTYRREEVSRSGYQYKSAWGNLSTHVPAQAVAPSDAAQIEAIVHSTHFQQAVEQAVKTQMLHEKVVLRSNDEQVEHMMERIHSLEQEVLQLRTTMKRYDSVLQQMQDHVMRATQDPNGSQNLPQREALLLVAEMAKQAQELLRAKATVAQTGIASL